MTWPKIYIFTNHKWYISTAYACKKEEKKPMHASCNHWRPRRQFSSTPQVSILLSSEGNNILINFYTISQNLLFLSFNKIVITFFIIYINFSFLALLSFSVFSSFSVRISWTLVACIYALWYYVFYSDKYKNIWNLFLTNFYYIFYLTKLKCIVC